MVGLREAWELVARGQVVVAQWGVHGVREENLVVHIDVLLDGLVWVQRRQFTFNDGLRTSDRRLHEVLVHFELRAILLHALEVRLAGEVLDDLEFLVPFAHGSGVVAKEWANSLAHSFKVRYFNLFVT